MRSSIAVSFSALALFLVALAASSLGAIVDQGKTVRVFVFAGQSNMEGADSKVADIALYPPFVGLDLPDRKVRFAYVIGREEKQRSKGWEPLQPVNGLVGPELSFAREVSRRSPGPIAIIKVAAGGTDLGGDWNPERPSGFCMYPLLLDTVRKSLAELDDARVDYRLEGFMWHQGENDQFNDGFRNAYGQNLAALLKRLRSDLDAPELRAYIGELCTKTIWGMDLRPWMGDIARGQRAAVQGDPLSQYVPTAHIAVEIGGGGGLHYHYGTLGQLEHGLMYAEAYLANIGQPRAPRPSLAALPETKSKPFQLYILAGHRNMEGERSFVQDLPNLTGGKRLVAEDPRVPFRYSTGGGVHRSNGWETLAPAGLFDTFGPELSFAKRLTKLSSAPIAIAKFTHSGSQIIDWTPGGSEVKERNLYPAFLEFIRSTLHDLQRRGPGVELAGIVYHVGENDMSFGPYRESAAERLAALVEATRRDLGRPELAWYVSQQPPTQDESAGSFDVMSAIAALAAKDRHLVHLPLQGIPEQREQLVFDTAGIVWLGERLAELVHRGR